MVLGVCRRVLQNLHDAEDAFQATFLILVRKARSVRPPEMVGNWLYGVAYRTALEAKRAAAKRRMKERQVNEMPRPETRNNTWEELQPVLDQEMTHLPNKYRAVLLLCDLEGKTRKEVARQLSLPQGTVASRLVTARTMLAKRLTQRGFVFSGGLLAALLSHNAASAGVPTPLVVSTVKAASLFAARQAAAGVISVKVAALTEGVLKSMLLAKLRIAVGVLLLLALIGSGLSFVNYNLQAADQVEARNETGKAAALNSSGPGALKKARLGAARKAYAKVWEQYRFFGLRDEEQVYRWSVRLLNAEREVAAKRAQRVAAFQGHLNRIKELQKTAPDRLLAVDLPLWREKEKGMFMVDKDGKPILMQAKGISRDDIAVLTTFYRAEAETWFAEAKAE
jgi:RNA polymerase sigma factor (sigma-70 family)